MNRRLRNIGFGLLTCLPYSAALVSPATNHAVHRTGETGNVPSVEVLLHSSTLGNLHRIRMPGEEEDGDDKSFLGTMGVPTYAAMPATDDISTQFNRQVDKFATKTQQRKARGLEGVLHQGPAFVLDNVLGKDVCENIIQDCEKLGFGNYNSGKNHHGAMQILVSPELAAEVGSVLSHHVDVTEVEQLYREMLNLGKEGRIEDEEDIRLVYAGLNRRWRIYRYNAGGEETFAPHIDAGFPPSGLSSDCKTLLWDSNSGEENVVSHLTVLMYLNDDFVGGSTNFYQPNSLFSDGESVPPLIASVRPVAGSALVFPQGLGEKAVEYARQHWPLHEGSPVVSGRPKYVIRSDILFATQRQRLPLEDRLFALDHLVRGTFLPRSSAMDKSFLSHLSSLYEPHMGVEHLGPFLYSFIRFTKKSHVVEIGAGYTSPWILQALKENDEELDRIKLLQQSNQCRLLDIQWTIPDVVDEYGQMPSSLLCIDNCAHQKETATGATAVAKALGLDKYMKFHKGDAFELDLEENSADILWCDFGVGSRMKEFISSAWKCLRPGGFLLCHSTLTNKNTREWLEAARSGEGQDATGIPPDEYVEISLLEPHKRYQNSISIFQKRRGRDGEVYEEPIYSQYA